MSNSNAPWTMADILCVASSLIIVIGSSENTVCEPKIRAVVADRAKKTGTYQVVVEGHPDEDLRRREGIWEEFDDDTASVIEQFEPSDHGEMIQNVSLEEAKRHWTELCLSYHNCLLDSEHLELRIADRDKAHAEGEAARAKLVLLEMQHLFPALFVSPARDTVANDVLRTLKPTHQYEVDLDEVVCFKENVREKPPASTDLGEWSVYVISNKRLTKHKSLRSASIALQNELNELPGVNNVVGMFLARSSVMAMRAFMRAPATE
ncbi:hypothetical protein V5O48_010595 [Marasmius crinis-equi]|uniref:Uncharacterized protein n=1 Tax=Marasmius crinis-equi TaxID=585013 RepID=A0ABR3F7Z0_9AGAR